MFKSKHNKIFVHYLYFLTLGLYIITLGVAKMIRMMGQREKDPSSITRGLSQDSNNNSAVVRQT